MNLNTPDASSVQPLLTTHDLGRGIVFLETADSTNRLARSMALEGLPHGLTVIAEQQTAGRGRLNHAWASPAGLNLYVSILLKPKTPAFSFPNLPILCAIALHQSLKRAFPTLTLRLKWPNDILTEHRKKLSGILCEAVTLADHSTAVIAGIGINVNSTLDTFPPELQQSATSLRIVTGSEQPRADILANFLNSLEAILDSWESAPQPTLSPWLEYWKQHDLLLGKDIAIDQDGCMTQGIASGITPEGQLLLQTKQGLIKIHAGDVHILF